MFHVKQNLVKQLWQCFIRRKQRVSRIKDAFVRIFAVTKRLRKLFHVKQNPEKHVSQRSMLVKHSCETFCQIPDAQNTRALRPFGLNSDFVYLTPHLFKIISERMKSYSSGLCG